MEEMEEADAVAEGAWTARASPSVSGDVAEHDDVMYCQKASLFQCPRRLMSI